MPPFLLLKRIINDYKSGESIRTLSHRYQYSVGKIYTILNTHGVVRKRNLVTSLNSKDNLLIGFFIGLWSGDGSRFLDQGKYTIKIHMHKAQQSLLRFISMAIQRLYNKSFAFYSESDTNRGTIKFYSKFIYQFIDRYLVYQKNKALTVKLKNKVSLYNGRFLRGFLLGITLSDGYLKERFVLNTISRNLSINVRDILRIFKFWPNIYKQDRRKYKTHDLYRLVLNARQTRDYKKFLQRIVRACHSSETIDVLKAYSH